SVQTRVGLGIPLSILCAIVAVLLVPAAYAGARDSGCGPGNGAPSVSMTVGTVTDLTIAVNGTVEPNGLQATAWFEYAPTGSQNGPSTDQQTSDSATAPLAVSALVTGLSPGKTYTVSLVATNDCANLATPSTVSREVTTASGLSVARIGTGSG